MPNSTPDPHAIKIAQAIKQAMKPNTVVLFGSRATGYHRDDSDVDILIIGTKPHLSATAGYLAAKAYMSANPPQLELDIVIMNTTEFQRCRKAKQHLAGQADHYGIAINGNKPGYSILNEDGYPDHWPETRNRLESALEWRKTLTDFVDRNYTANKSIGFSAQQAVENGLRGLLSAYNDPVLIRHDLSRIWNRYIERYHDERDPNTEPLHSAVTRLLGKTTQHNPASSDQHQILLREYARDIISPKPSRRIGRSEKMKLRDLVNTAVAHLVTRIHELSGTSDADLFLDGVPWETPTAS